MKNKWLKLTGAMVAVGALTTFSTVQAASMITGSINFNSGQVTLNGDGSIDGTVTTITIGSGSVVAGGGQAPTGTFAGITAGTTAAFYSSAITFSPSLSPNPISDLWTVNFGGEIYTFNLTGITSSIGVGPALNLSGTGTLDGTGTVTYAETPGTWTFTATGTGNNGVFGFVAGSAATPDGGATVMLLGAALSTLGLLRKKLIA